MSGHHPHFSCAVVSTIAITCTTTMHNGKFQIPHTSNMCQETQMKHVGFHRECCAVAPRPASVVLSPPRHFRVHGRTIRTHRKPGRRVGRTAPNGRVFASRRWSAHVKQDATIGAPGRTRKKDATRAVGWIKESATLRTGTNSTYLRHELHVLGERPSRSVSCRWARHLTV